jgi:bifunctional non-homologous end joining protein LigD
MIKGLKKMQPGEPACQKRSDSDHLRFVIHRKDDEFFDFSIELNGIKSWAVPGVPSMNPLDQKTASEDGIVAEIFLNAISEQDGSLQMWDKGNYIPIDDCGNVLSEREAIECFNEGILKFFLQGTKLVGEFVLMKKGKESWLLMKRHDQFALYNNYDLETVAG